MFHHVVLIRFKEALSAADRAVIEGEIAGLRKALPDSPQIELVDNVASRSRDYKHAFVCTFKDSAAHDAYQAHEAHVRLRDFISARADELLALDYER